MLTPPPHQICFATLKDDKSQDIMSFADIQQNEVFEEWRIESQSDNCILIELSVPNFLEALSAAEKAPQCQLKLTKRNGLPVLCVETRMLEVDVVHDIKVKVMRASEYEYYKPPDVPQPTVQLELPTQKSLKNVVDKLKGISRSVYLKGEMVGNLTVEADTDAVGIKTFFTDLCPRFESLDEDACQNNVTTMKVDTKKLSMVLQAYNTLGRVKDMTIIMCMIEAHSLILHVLVSQIGTLTFYVNVMEMDEDDAHNDNDAMAEDPIEVDNNNNGHDDDMS